MIKVNLSTTQKPASLSSVGGIDLSKLKPVAIFLAILALYIPDFTILEMWNSEYNEKTNELNQLSEKSNALKTQISEYANLERQIRELKAQEENLGQKLTAVKQAISQKRNPASLLLYISKNIPQDLWITDLSIENELMVVKGEALNYTSVGNFVNNMRSSIFIRDASIKGTTSSVRESDKRRIESFEIHFAIARLE